LGITDNNEKYYICNVCNNNNDEPIEVVILVSVSQLVLFIADILVIGISVNLLIGAPLLSTQREWRFNLTTITNYSTIDLLQKIH